MFLHFIYIQFEDARDAEDAIEGRDGYKFDGQRLRVSVGMSDLIAFCSNVTMVINAFSLFMFLWSM